MACKPKQGETRQEFMDRCMKDDSMKKEYPDPSVRYIACQKAWKEKPPGTRGD